MFEWSEEASFVTKAGWVLTPWSLLSPEPYFLFLYVLQDTVHGLASFPQRVYNASTVVEIVYSVVEPHVQNARRALNEGVLVNMLGMSAQMHCAASLFATNTLSILIYYGS